ncbi:MAG TPA: Hsp33 family molecular chaperone HslO, partial [Planctomycetota bacterium]|nr:Hsp33 family molecular chaperone HslO [Planctomycetota bacterium]
VLLQAGPDVDRDWFHARRLRRAELGRILLEERDPEKVIARAFEGEAWDVVARRPIRFRCRCSRERVERMIAGLDREELADMIEKDKGAMVTCHFCNDQYEIAEEELKSMLERRGGGGPGGAPAGRGG